MSNAEQQARSQVESLVEMVAAVRNAHDDEHREAAETAIHEDPLSIEVRGDWHAVGTEMGKLNEFKIELCTGGPAVRIIGELNEYNEPESGFIQFQDWFTGWQLLALNDTERDAVLENCRQFYFAEA
jgi:hypothetical protein